MLRYCSSDPTAKQYSKRDPCNYSVSAPGVDWQYRETTNSFFAQTFGLESERQDRLAECSRRCPCMWPMTRSCCYLDRTRYQAYTWRLLAESERQSFRRQTLLPPNRAVGEKREVYNFLRHRSK